MCCRVPCAAWHNDCMSSWTFLTHHAHVLLEVAKNPDATVQQLADEIGISTRSTVTILGDLITALAELR